MKRGLLFILLALFSIRLSAQVTTSSMYGIVKDAKEPLAGATVKATHMPSGTVYGVSTNAEGRYTIPGMRVGGPYKIEVSFLGYQSSKYDDITLALGEAYVLNIALSQAGKELQAVVVLADRSNQVKTGASTNVSRRQLTTLPTISRSITDFTRLTPQSNGTNFAGRDARYNNIQVDGANLNNNFGLSNDPLPGGGAQPISIDSYDQLSINIAPYDVRQSGFTGAGITAVTKSGTNEFHGSAYGFYRDQSFIGTRVGDNSIKSQIVNSNNKVYGFNLGGPIIKDKVFFFAGLEFEEGKRPGITFAPTGGVGSGNTSSTNINDLRTVSDFLRNTYGYETGAYDAFPNFSSKNHKVLAKLDWNINDKNKLTLKYSDFVGNDDQALNATSIPNGGGFRVDGLGQNQTISRLPQNRFGLRSMAFANSNYGFRNITRSGTAELNSTISSKMSNQLLLTFTRNKSTRTFPNEVFPSVDIFDGAGNNYISFGMDPYTYNNDVVNDIYSVTDNFTYYAGKHTLTGGVNYEYQKVGNMFMAGSNSYYAFNSLNDFLNNRAPAYYAYTYSLVPGQKSVYSAELQIGQLGLYAQDEYNVRDNLKLTLGIRGDMPVYGNQPLENPSISALSLYDKNGNRTSYSTGAWPKNRMLFSPRLGFRWDVMEDNSLIVRGGTGIFTGRIPFVYLTNMPTNSGMYQFGASLRNANTAEAARLANIRFSPDPDAYANLFPTTAGGTVPTNFVVMDKDFKFPSVFRSNLAVEKNLGNGFVASAEGLFTKDINAVRMFNANVNPTSGIVVEGDNTRPRYTSAAGRNLYSNVNTAIVLANTNKGYSSSVTGQLSKTFSNGLYGSVAYTYTNAKDVTANPGSQASSVWNLNPNVGTSNAIELFNSQYATPHRVIGSISYRKEYARHFASTLSFFYQGQNQGNLSYVVNGDINGDGNNAADLMYIPRNASEVNFQNYTATVNGQVVTFTAQQQAEAMEQFINNSSYLKNHRGQYAERNGALLPWYNRVDMRFLQDFFIERNGRRHTLQFSADILNFTNLLNKNWGVQQLAVINNPFIYRSINASTNQPVYSWQNIGGNLVTAPYQQSLGTSSTWSMQLGLRYSF